MAVLLASGLFLFRGPLRAESARVNDFAAPYASARLWLQGRNPYDAHLFFPTWRAAGAPKGNVYYNESGTHSVYPPPSLVAVLPLALLPWPVASMVLVWISAAVYVFALVLLASFVPGSWREATKPVFLAFGLAFAPAQSALHVTNLACLSASLLFVAIYLLVKQLPPSNQSQVLAAVCIALSICLKAALGLLLVPYLLWARGWRALAVTGLIVGVTTAVSLYPSLKSGSAWFDSLRFNSSVAFANGGSSDVAETNLNRFDRIDLQLPIYAMTHHRGMTAAIACLIGGGLLMFWFFCKDPDRGVDQHLLRIGTLFGIGLLPVYQRYYMAVLLLIPLVWAFRNLEQRAAKWTAGLCAVFLVNTGVLLQRIGLVRGLAVHHPHLANILAGPHVCWLLLGMAFLLLRALRSQGRSMDFAGFPSVAGGTTLGGPIS
ncbi:MAG TPA: glycosyltransferase family 87 protein [Edaphobacter sp.]